jgi:hypothetical protein
MDPIIPPERVTTKVTRRETHGNGHNEVFLREVSNVATDAAMDVPKVSSRVHFASKHGCKISVEFFELH